MEATVEMSGCDSLSLYVEGWDYQASCEEEPAYDQTQFLDLGPKHSIFMKRRLGESTPSIDGSVTFKSLNQDKLAMVCVDAVYVIPPPATTAITTTILLKTDTSAPSPLPTILGIVAGILYGINIILLIICLFMRYRKKKRALEDKQQEEVSIQDGLASERDERHYENLNPSASVNEIYDVMSSIDLQTKDDDIYENGQSLQVQTSDYPAINAIAVDSENILNYQKSERDGCYENVVIVKDQTSHDLVLYANGVILRDQMSLDSIS